jgi:arabinogalactan oligomer/maltooligosaccharide transport system substrate-binding protein
MILDEPDTAADVYLFANDQIGVLREIGAISELYDEYARQVLADNAQVLVDTVTYTDGGLYGFPIANNTWFMYYNKDVFTEEDVKSLDTMLTKGTVAFPWENGWYSGTFFLANGGQIFGEQGNDAYAGIQFGAENGGHEAALKMIQLAKNPNFKNDLYEGSYWLSTGEIDAFFSGSWDAAGLRESMGDRLGVAALPTVEIGGEQKQMKAFAGSKVVGVNPYSDNQELALEFAAHLASVESQKLRYQARMVIPAAKELINDPIVSSNPAAVAEMNTMTYASVKQPTIPEMGNYWMPMGDFGFAISNGEVTEDNYQEYVDFLMMNFGNEETEDGFQITDVQVSGFVTEDITLRFHYHRPDGNYAGWNLWLWDNSSVSDTELNPPYEFEWIDGEMICTVKVAPETSEVGYVVRYLDWVDKDIYEDRFVDLYDVCGGTVDIYIESGEPWFCVDYQDVIWGVGFAYLDYNRDSSRLVLGLTSAYDDLCPVLSTGGKTIDIIKETAVGYNYFLTLDQPLEPGSYTLTTNAVTITFDIA